MLHDTIYTHMNFIYGEFYSEIVWQIFITKNWWPQKLNPKTNQYSNLSYFKDKSGLFFQFCHKPVLDGLNN